MASDLDKWLEQLPAKIEQRAAAKWAQAVEAELVAPIRDAARKGKTLNLSASVRKTPGENDLEWIVEAGGVLTTKNIGTRTYRRVIDISSGDTQSVPKGNAPVVYDYALGEEFGNSHYNGQPFFYGTARAHAEALQQRAQEIIADEIGKE